MTDLHTIELPANDRHVQTLEVLCDHYRNNYDWRGSERSRVLASLLNALLDAGGLSKEHARRIVDANEADFAPCWAVLASWARDMSSADEVLVRVSA